MLGQSPVSIFTIQKHRLILSLGYASVVKYAQNKASRIIIASRSIKRIDTAIEQVYRDVPNYRGKIDAMELDLSSFSSVIGFCEKIRSDPGRLDIVLANAGIMKAKYGQTMDGHEETMQVNGLSTGLMALLLLPKLEETAGVPAPNGSEGVKPSMCIVSSEGESPSRSCKIYYSQ
jgi:retinol dehydrogenase-12